MLFLAAVGFRNFYGAGVFGFLINLPAFSYYEIGTQLTANHGHAAMLGVYGRLAIALLVFCMRDLVCEEDWSARLVGFAFWGLNLGLAWMRSSSPTTPTVTTFDIPSPIITARRQSIKRHGPPAWKSCPRALRMCGVEP